MAAIKLSVSLDEGIASRLRERARVQRKSFSAVLNEALAQAERERALDEVLECLGAPEVSREEVEETLERWGLASRSTPARSSASKGAARRR